MTSPQRRRFRLSGGTDLSFVAAGDPSAPTVLLLHGFPASSRSFRDVVPDLAQVAHVVAPDIPGSGESEPLAHTSFAAQAEAVGELLDALEVQRRYVYLHDFGAPVGFHLAMADPEALAGLIVQNANAHRSGFGPSWADTLAFHHDPTPANEAAATAHLTAEGVRDQYVAGVPEDVVARIAEESWQEDWRVMCLPGRLDAQRALVRDYGRHIERFDEIAAFLAREQPPALMLWGRHDAFFELDEVMSWLHDLPRMEAHVFDAGHFLLETHAPRAAALMVDFVERTEALRWGDARGPQMSDTGIGP